MCLYDVSSVWCWISEHEKSRTIIKMEFFPRDKLFMSAYFICITRPHSLTLSIIITAVRDNKISQSHMRYKSISLDNWMYSMVLNVKWSELQVPRKRRKAFRSAMNMKMHVRIATVMVRCNDKCTVHTHTHKTFTSFFRVITIKHYH